MPTDATTSTRAADMATPRTWMVRAFTSAPPLPLSFIVDETYIAGSPAAWCPVTHGHARFDPIMDTYADHCGRGARLGLGVDSQCNDYASALAPQRIDLWHSAAPFIWYGNDYPHTPSHRGPQAWVVWHDRPEAHCRMIQGIRLPTSPQERFTIRPQDINTAARYRFEQGKTGDTQELPGEVLLRDGFTLTAGA